MLDDLIAVIETIKNRIRQHGQDLSHSEALTRYALIDPILRALGWNTDDPELVRPEYRVDVGWADYALQGQGDKPSAVVEAKRLGSFVENHLSQAVGYCIEQGIAYTAITDGNHWQLYRTFDQVPMEQKRILDVQISAMQAHECALHFLLLWRPNLATGKAIPANEPIFSAQQDAPGPQATYIQDPAAVAPPSPSNEGWIRLVDIQTQGNGIVGYPHNLNPSVIRLPDGSDKHISRWWEIIREVAEYLVGKHKLTSEVCPIREGKNSYFLYAKPQPDKAGNTFHLHQLSNGLYLTKSNTGAGLVNNARFLMHEFGESAESVRIRFG